jgi:hypothetical protein
MKIPCFVKKFVEREYFPFIKTYIKGKGRLSLKTDALIDTGSPYTVLSPRDALRINLPLRKAGPTVQLAGTIFYRNKIGNATFYFISQDQELLKFNHVLEVLTPTKHINEIWEEIRDIPSIIGNNFLRTHRLALYFNPAEGISYLEI